MVSQRFSKAPSKRCRKSVKADLVCFYKSTQLFAGVWQTHCVPLAHCFTPSQSEVLRKTSGVCDVLKNDFLQRPDELSIDLRKICN